jgi:oligopeptidase B
MNNSSKIYQKINSLRPPIAEIKPHSMEIHGDSRIDNYYWMRLSDEQKMATSPDAHTQNVVSYLEQENKYRSVAMADLDEFQSELFEEIKSRIKQTDMSVPYKSNGYWYISKYEEGKEYPIYSRKKGDLAAQEEVLIDVNKLAAKHDYYNTSGNNISPNNRYFAYGEDTLSRRIYTIKIKDLTTDSYLEDEIPNTTGYVVWAEDNKTLFYTVKDETLRPYKIFRHILGTPASEDVEIYHEADDTFYLFIKKSKSKKFLVIGSSATLTNEFQILEADNPYGEFRTFQKRIRGLEYTIDHLKEKWYIRTNDNKATNFKLSICDSLNTEKENWETLIEHREKVLLEGFDLFDRYIVLSERINGITQLRVKSSLSDHYIDFGEEAFYTYTSRNPEAETDLLRLEFTSMTTPNSTYDYNMEEQTLCLLKQQEVIGSFSSKDYKSERLYATAADGTEIPISLVYKKDLYVKGKNPLLLYAYGSYGNSMDPYFSSVRLSLLDRGFVYAIAHVRGGQELGRKWYEDGKLLNKRNTFTDFNSCGAYLKNLEYCAPDQLYAMGGSAGGLLIGAVINMKPDLWKAAIAAVPFVDVVTTMLDETIPLTTGEFDEWGNPKDKVYYDYIKSYSPYDNIEAKDYPALLITTGYHDSQVQYWEPAKWIAKLRLLKTDNEPLLMYCNMDTGHGGQSGRFSRYKEIAMEYAFLLDLSLRS